MRPIQNTHCLGKMRGYCVSQQVRHRLLHVTAGETQTTACHSR
jgi:hypothetical protein